MRVEVVLWIVFNLVSLSVAGKELWVTGGVWFWTRRNLNRKDTMHRIAMRNVRTSLFKFLLALSFVVAGFSVLIPHTGTFRVWLLILGSIILTVDIVWESKYRGSIFEVARRRAKKDHDLIKEESSG